MNNRKKPSLPSVHRLWFVTNTIKGSKYAVSAIIVQQFIRKYVQYSYNIYRIC